MKKFLTVNEVAELLGVHWQSVLNYIRRGHLEAVKLGRGYRISPDALQSFIDKNTKKVRR